MLCAALILGLILLAACGAAKPSSLTFQAMDTVMTLTVYGDDSACEQLRQQIEALDAALDVTDENSEIYRLNTARTAAISDSAADLLSRSLSYCARTDGRFDITVCPAVQAWGFLSGDYRVPDDSELAALADKIDYRAVTLDGRCAALSAEAQLDLGAVAKGYAADICSEYLRDTKAQAAVLNLGGTIALCGRKPDGSRFKVGVADPEAPAGYFGYLSLDQGIVATSGGYERYFEQDGVRYIHILDPATAAPVDNSTLSVTVVSDNGAYADALSTALFVMGPDKAADYYRRYGDLDYLILTDSGDLYITEGVYDDFSLVPGYNFTLHKISE